MALARWTKPKSAARRLIKAKALIEEAVKLIWEPKESRGLIFVSVQLGKMGDLFAQSRIYDALDIPLADTKIGAKAMGSSRSPKKLKALEKAREILKDKRGQRQVVRRTIRQKQTGWTVS